MVGVHQCNAVKQGGLITYVKKRAAIDIGDIVGGTSDRKGWDAKAM